MSACVEQFASYVNVLENALDMIDDDVSLSSLGEHSDIVKIIDTIMEVNAMLVYRFQCGPVPRKDMADIRKKVGEAAQLGDSNPYSWRHKVQKAQALQKVQDPVASDTLLELTGLSDGVNNFPK